ncbi:MAG: cytochrome b/b6 domain-containing protein [Oricola sp.]
MARMPLNTRDPFAGYNLVSIVLHWFTAVAVVVLYLTHERETEAIHLAIGLIATPFFLARIWRRFARGYARISDQPAILNLLSRLVTFGFLLCLLSVIVTGLAIPPFKGEALAVPGLFSLNVPVPANRALAHLLEEIHDLAGHAFLPLLALHVIGALKHFFVDRDAVVMRMVRPVPNGK